MSDSVDLVNFLQVAKSKFSAAGQGRYHQSQVVRHWRRAVLQALLGKTLKVWQGHHKWWLTFGDWPWFLIWEDELAGTLGDAHDCLVAFILTLVWLSYHCAVSDCPKWPHFEEPRLPTRLCIFCVLYVYVCVRACDMYVNYVYITI